MSKFEIEAQAVRLFKIPKNVIEATIVLKVGHLPVVTVKRFLLPGEAVTYEAEVEATGKDERFETYSYYLS